MTSTTSESGPRPRGCEVRDLRGELLRRSRELLDEGGPSALSMREAARRAGCTHQAPYHYFANREAILAALVVDGFRELARRMSAAHDRFEDEGLSATLEASANAYVEFALNTPGVFRIMFRPDMCDPERFPEVRSAGEAARAELSRLVRIALGERATPEAEVLFWAEVHGLATLLLDGPLAAQVQTESERLDLAHRVTAASVGPLTSVGG